MHRLIRIFARRTCPVTFSLVAAHIFNIVHKKPRKLGTNKTAKNRENWEPITPQSVEMLTLWAYLADNKLMIFSFFSQKIGFDISCKLSPEETICMKCQSLYTVKIETNISKCRLLIFFLPRMQSVRLVIIRFSMTYKVRRKI